MSSAARNSDPTVLRRRTRLAGGERSFRLLRYSHVFASVVGEVLEGELLRKMGRCLLTRSQFHLMKLMSIDGSCQIGEVADFLGVSAPAASKNVDKLERLGLLVRRPSKEDRRATLLSASRKGRRLVHRFEELRATRLSPALEAFRPEEIDQLAELLERFSVSLLEMEPTSQKFCRRCAACVEDGCRVSRFHSGCSFQKVRDKRRGEGAKGKVS